MSRREPHGARIGPGGCRLFLLIPTLFLLSGCQYMSSSSRRTGLVATGAATGGALAYELGGRTALAAGAGSVGGAALTGLALGKDPELLQEGFDQGYLQGQSDAIKREYFLRQAREARPLASVARTQPTTYCLPGPQLTPDGRRLQPHLVPLRVAE